MPPEELWNSFFAPQQVLCALGLTAQCDLLVEFGCGYGTFTIPAAQTIRGTVHAIDIAPKMLVSTQAKVEACKLTNVTLHQRDFTVEGSGLPDNSADYVMLFNILHAEERMVLLNEAWRVLKSNGRLAVIHWNYDSSTPRGPSMSIRPRPEECCLWAEHVGFSLMPPGKIDLPPYHYGVVFQRSE